MHQNHVTCDIQENTFLNSNIICFYFKSIDVHLLKYVDLSYWKLNHNIFKIKTTQLNSMLLEQKRIMTLMSGSSHDMLVSNVWVCKVLDRV